MTVILDVFLNVIPKAKGRPRFSRGRVFTPKRTKASEAEIKYLLKDLYKGDISRKPLKVIAHFFMPRLKTKARTYPVNKPDLDNILKLCLDSCNGLVFADDSQVISIEAHKRFEIPQMWPTGIQLIIAELPD